MQPQVSVIAERSRWVIKGHEGKEYTKAAEGPDGYREVLMITGEAMAHLKGKLKCVKRKLE